jgi:hypothetical protein
MKKVTTFFYIILFGLSLSSFAKKVEISDAKLVGKNFFYERINQYRNVSYSSLVIKEAFTEMKNGIPVYYIFNFNDTGYIVVAADDAVPPILAYSFESSYSENEQPPQFTAWMQQYARQIEFAINGNKDSGIKTKQEWSQLSTNDPQKLSVFKGREVQPFTTSKWNQNAPYNCMCPADPAGPGGHALAGCVPTAMGQIMYYYRWPETGIGSYTYTDSTYGVQSVDFGSATYKWNNMKNSISKANTGIGELLYHLGVSCDLVYGPGASGMYNHKAAYSLRTYFKYSPQTQYVFRDSTTLDWDSLIIAHLDRRMPLYYAGWSVPNINGHAFVCDGYQDSLFFHFNFGWGGSNNGYFYLDNLTPGGNNFNLAQELIINCYPDTVNFNYPVYCKGTTDTLRYREGTIVDGSGPLNDYQSPASCSWILMPQDDEDSVSSITLTFDSFDTGPGDSVIIHDGGLENSPVIGSFSGETLPSSVTSSGNTVLIRFKATSGQPATGWSLTYTTKIPTWCSGTTTITSDTSEFSDGSFRFNYHNSSSCKWKLLPEKGDTLTIYFRSFDTEPDFDVLKIYDLDTQSLLASISGHYDEGALPEPVVSPGGKMLLVFTTNSSVSGKGWEIYYPKSTLGISENSIHDLKIYPNPANDFVNVSFYNEKSKEATIDFYSASGQLLKSENYRVSPGFFNASIGTESLPNGLYLLRIATDREVLLRKINISQE